MQRYIYKETRVKRAKENGYYAQIEGLKNNSERYDHLYETVDMMMSKLTKLSRLTSQILQRPGHRHFQVRAGLLSQNGQRHGARLQHLQKEEVSRVLNNALVMQINSLVALEKLKRPPVKLALANVLQHIGAVNLVLIPSFKNRFRSFDFEAIIHLFGPHVVEGHVVRLQIEQLVLPTKRRWRTLEQ